MNSIAQALSSGYSVKKILEFLGRSHPALALKINAGIAAGHTLEKILYFIEGAGEKASKILSGENGGENNLYKKSQSVHPGLKTGFKILAGATTAAAAGIAGITGMAGRGAAVRASQILPALAPQGQLPGPAAQAPIGNISPLPQNPAVPQAPNPTPLPQNPAVPQAPNPTPLPQNPTVPQAPNPTPLPMNMTPGQQINAGAGQTNPNQMAQAAQAMPQQMPPIDSESIINQMGLKYKLINLQNAGNDPSQIAAGLEIQLNPNQKKWLKSQTQMPLSEIVKDYIQKQGNQPQVNAQNTQIQPENTPIQVQESKIEPEKPQKIEKGSEVLTPNGIGHVKGTDSKGLIVESEGKAHRIPHEEAISSPLPEKDMAELYTELVNKIPESERSSMINVAGYDPNHNEFIFMPHDGALYVYKDIPEEFAQKIQQALFQAKTTGSNFYGAWSQGEESRGAGLSALIRELQKLYGGKGKEYVRKYEKVYDFFALPKAAVKAKEKKEREERKKRK